MKATDEEKLDQLSEQEGLSVDEMLEEGTFNSICPAICMNVGCNYTASMEPDQDRGYCEDCNTNSMKSALVLAGII